MINTKSYLQSKPTDIILNLHFQHVLTDHIITVIEAIEVLKLHDVLLTLRVVVRDYKLIIRAIVTFFSNRNKSFLILIDWRHLRLYKVIVNPL